MHPDMTPREYNALCLKIDQLRSQLEDAVLSASPEETLSLSRELDALLNRLMFSRSRMPRRSRLFALRDAHVYGQRASMRHGARILSFHRNA